MSLSLTSIGRLKPEVRLAQSIERFQSVLSTEQRAAFHAGRTLAIQSCPQMRDVMHITAEIERQARASNGGGRRCFGSRVTKVLQSMQEFISVGGILVGGSQNLIASGVWSLVRLSLLTTARFSTYLEKLSELLMVVGRSAPRYQEMTALHPRSKPLQRLGIEYVIAIVDLCHEVVAICNKSTAGQLKSFFRQFDISSHQSKILEWSEAIKDQLNLEEAKENSQARGIINKFTAAETRRRKMSDRATLLDACSTFDYQMAWKQARKCGDATWFLHDEKYIQWKTSMASSTISVSGKLGAGKTVVLANMLDDILLTTKNHVVAYFFCRSDHIDSRKSRNVIGCLARQILEALPPEDTDRLLSGLQPKLSVENIKQLFIPEVFRLKHIFIIVDGIDECDQEDRSNIIEFLRYLQSCCRLKVCVSHRSTADLRVRNELAALKPAGAIQLPQENPDIISFIQAKLELCIETGKLTLGDPTIILEISQALEAGAQGMFLWVVLQIENICAQKTDSKIRKALRSLPRDLPEAFARSLTIAETTLEPEYQKRLLTLILAAVRPLTMDELREALSVTPFVFTWNPSNLINDIQVVLSAGGSLLIVDEEQFTVHFIHPSVKQILLGDLGPSHNFHIDCFLAGLEMAQIVLTYLAYNVFDKQVARVHQTPNFTGRKVCENIVSSTLTSPFARSMALNLLRSRRQTDFDVGKALSSFKRTPDVFLFHQYASENWLAHTKVIGLDDAQLWPTIREVLRREQKPLMSEFAQRPEWDDLLILPPAGYNKALFRLHTSVARLRSTNAPLLWAIENSHLGIFRLMIRGSIRNVVSVIAYFRFMRRIRQAGVFSNLRIPLHFNSSILGREIYLKSFCLAAIFGDHDICNDLLRQPSPPVPLSKLLKVIPLVSSNALAIALALVQAQALHGFGEPILETSAAIHQLTRDIEAQVGSSEIVILHANDLVTVLSDQKGVEEGHFKVLQHKGRYVFSVPWNYLRPSNQFNTCCDIHVGIPVGPAALCACCVPHKYRQIVGQLGDLRLKEQIPCSNPKKSYWSSILEIEDDPSSPSQAGADDR